MKLSDVVKIANEEVERTCQQADCVHNVLRDHWYNHGPELLAELKECLKHLDTALEYEGDVFGAGHNGAIDACMAAEASIAAASEVKGV